MFKNEYPVADLSIEEYPVHVLTAALKCFLRELPEPLLTFELYDEFLQASGKIIFSSLFPLLTNLSRMNFPISFGRTSLFQILGVFG